METPVSYTHLANRQCGAARQQDSGLSAQLEARLRGFGAVSYTHLDVYKRQVQDIGADCSRTAKNNANTLQTTVKGLSKNGL